MLTIVNNHSTAGTTPASEPRASASGPASDGFQTVFSQLRNDGAAAATQPASAYEQNVHTTLAGGADMAGVDVANNSLQFATAAAAEALAKKLGGHVREDSLAGTYACSAPQRMIVGESGKAINAGLAADLFAKYGDAPGSEAWNVIHRDLGQGS